MQGPYERDYEQRELKELVIEHLASLDEQELKALARENHIDISGLNAKSDLVDAIAIYPGIVRILGLVDSSEVPQDEGDESQTDETEVESQEKAEETTEFDDRVRQAMRTSLDLSILDQLISEAASRFGDKGYDGTLEIARDAIGRLEEKSRDYLEAVWAYTIVATQNILETSDDATSAAKEAADRLEEAKRAFDDGSTVDSRALLDDLISAGLDLFNLEMERAKEDAASHEAFLAEVKSMGGEVSESAALLSKARAALDNNNRSLYLEIIAEVDRLLAATRESRVEELKEAADGVTEIIEDARSIGADVEESSNLLDQVRGAIDAGDFVSANDLASRAEQAALEAQKAHMDKVVQLREDQLVKAKNLITQVKPMLERARREGFESHDALADLKAAAEYVNAGDYVNALMRARRAHRLVGTYLSRARGKPVDESSSEQTEVEPDLVEVEEVPTTEEEMEGEPETAGREERRVQRAPICPHCGSEKLKVGKRGKGKCLECGRKLKLSR